MALSKALCPVNLDFRMRISDTTSRFGDAFLWIFLINSWQMAVVFSSVPATFLSVFLWQLQWQFSPQGDAQKSCQYICTRKDTNGVGKHRCTEIHKHAHIHIKCQNRERKGKKWSSELLSLNLLNTALSYNPKLKLSNRERHSWPETLFPVLFYKLLD